MKVNRVLRRCYSSSGEVLNRTALYDWHISKGAKMVEYAGWEMPLQYSGQTIIESNRRTRNRASLFDVSHMLQLTVSGDHRTEFMESLMVGDFTNLQKNNSVLSLMTNNTGGIIDDTVVTNLGDRYGMVVNAGCAEKDLRHLERHEANWRSMGKDVYVTHKDSSLFALQGPISMYILRNCCKSDTSLDVLSKPFMSYFKTFINDIPIEVTRCGYTGEDGFEISVSNDAAEEVARILTSYRECKPAGLAVRDTLRLEAGLCLYGNDIDEHTTPVEAGLSWTIPKSRRDESSKTKFPGWDIIMDQIRNKSHLRRRIGFMSQNRRSFRNGSDIYDANNNVIGVVTSGTMSPTLDLGIGMGYINWRDNSTNKGLFVKVRETSMPLKVVKMPFVKSNYYNKV